MQSSQIPGSLRLSGGCLLVCLFLALPASGQPAVLYDIAKKPPGEAPLTRIHGSVGVGSSGVPITQPGDVDGDGFQDFGIGFMRASPLGRTGAGEVNLVFGSGHLGEVIDTALNTPRIVRIAGEDPREAAGDEVWFGDVNGDGLSDLLIGRQNNTPNENRIGAGALSILLGSQALRQFAAGREHLDLANPDPPAGLQIFTIRGRAFADRLGIWMRTGDVDGDGIDDIVVAADQEDTSGSNSGAGYLIRGGSHLSTSAVVDLDAIAGTPLEGNVARLLPPPGSINYHLGATSFIADLDGNGRAEVLLAATLNRSGAFINPDGAPPGTAVPSSGAPRGRLYIAWDDNFPEAPWPADFDLQFGSLPGSETVAAGGPRNSIFGEEIIGGADFDGNGMADLFVGDFVVDETGLGRSLSGAGYVFYDAAQLKGQSFPLNALPAGLTMSVIAGPSSSAIAGDTATAADFDGDGYDDLAFGAPHHDPQGRDSAGSIFVFFGQPQRWPGFMSTVEGRIPPPSVVRITEIQGAHGTDGPDRGDTLCYSASSGDADGDGIADLLTNEMVGNGLAPGTIDVGNLIIIGGPDLADQEKLDFAQVGNGGGFTSRLELSNPDPEQAVFASARFIDSEGNPLPLPLLIDGGAPAGAGASSEIEVEIPPLGVVSVRTDGTGEVVAGTARVTSNAPLAGLIYFTIPDLGLAGIPASGRFSNFMTVVRREGAGEILTGVAVSNLGSETAVVTPRLQDTGGQFVRFGDDIALPPGGHFSKFFSELFAEPVEDDFVGTLVILCEGCSLAAVALELGVEPGNFTAVPVVGLPVVPANLNPQ